MRLRISTRGFVPPLVGPLVIPCQKCMPGASNSQYQPLGRFRHDANGGRRWFSMDEFGLCWSFKCSLYSPMCPFCWNGARVVLHHEWHWLLEWRQGILIWELIEKPYLWFEMQIAKLLPYRPYWLLEFLKCVGQDVYHVEHQRCLREYHAWFYHKIDLVILRWHYFQLCQHRCESSKSKGFILLQTMLGGMNFVI